MAQIVKELRVDVSQPNVFQAIVAKQHDSNSRFLKITLVDFGVKVEVPNTAKVTINANRPDGASESFKGEANNDGTITVPLAQWMLDIDGEVKCDVSVTNTEDNKRLTSTDFWLEVQKAANPNASIPLDPDGEILIIKPVTEINGNSKDTDYPSAKAVYDYGQNIVTDTQITATATGSAITIDSAKAPLQQLKLYGKTTQDGTPTPTSPIELKSIGDSGSFEVGVYGENLLGLDEAVIGASYGVTFTINAKEGYIEANGTATDISYVVISRKTINLPEGSYVLSGCANGGGVNTYALASNGNVNLIDHGDGSKVGVVTKTNKINNIVFIVYKGTTVNNLRVYPMLRLANITDSTFEPCNKQALIINDTLRGIGDITDEKNFAKGVKIQRIQNAIPSNFNLAKYSLDVGNGYFGAYITTGTGYPAKTCVGISSHFPMLTWNDVGKKAGVFIGNYVTPTHIFVPETIASDVATLKQWLIDNDVKIYYPLKEPIETPLTETELNDYRQLMTNKGTTTILSEAEAEVDYYVNKPNAQSIGNLHTQINKDYFKLQQAIITTGGN